MCAVLEISKRTYYKYRNAEDKDYYDYVLIKEIFENSYYIGTFSNDKNVENVIDIKRFQKKINLSTGQKAYAYITIKNTVQQKDKLYSVELILKKYPSSINDNGVHQGITKSNASNNFIIQDDNYLSIKPLKKSLTYSGHKLQGRTKLYGMDISIENKKGSYRSGVDGDGHKWRIKMNYDYGYIRGTEGVDGDHVDCYVGPDKEAQKVYVIHQNNPNTHKYDEDKCMLCFTTADKAKKAYMSQYDRPGFYGSMDILSVEQFKSYVFSHLGKKIHKSFDVVVTDITENNKNKKVEQLQKSLEATLNNKPFVIKHVAADGSKKLNDVVLRISNFDSGKIEKAVHSMAMSLDADIPLTGEAFMYKSQEELTNLIVKEITEKTNEIYSFVIDYFDLPEIRVVSKAFLRHKGKIVFDPSTGQPIEKAEWKTFIKHLEDLLNSVYGGMGKKIVIKAQSLGRMLNRLSKAKSLSEIKKMPLKDLEVNHRKFDWISQTAKTMENALGESVKDRRTQASIQVAIDSAAQRVTRVTDNLRNDIQQIIIDGVKDHNSKSQVSQKLFDKCVGLNRDFQKIADSEIQSTVNMAYLKEEVYNTKEGEKVYFKRFEHDDEHTCKKCKAIKGALALWSDVALPDEHIDDEFAEYAIWEGKTSGELPATILHPYCYSDDTEVMTNSGWKLFKDLLDDDLIMSINPENRKIDFIPFVNRTTYKYDGDMIHFPGRNFDLLVTPNHNMLAINQGGKLYEAKAEELISKTDFTIPRGIGVWNGDNPKTIKLGDKEYSYSQYIKLWAWYLSEGSGRKRGNSYEIKLAQKNINKILDDIPEFADDFIKGKEAIYCCGEIAKQFEFIYKNHAIDKYIPEFIKNCKAEIIREFLKSYNLGDGSKRCREQLKNKLGIINSHDEVIRTASTKMMNDICELIVKAGWLPSVSVLAEKGKVVNFKNGTYKLNTDCYIINICKSKTKVYTKRKNPGHPDSYFPIKENYSGMVYDVELEKWHFLLVKRNGKCSWSGNCRGSWYRYYPFQKDNK